MKIIIHRGTQEIGGTVIEIQSKSSRILLEAGYPLFLNNNVIAREISFCSPGKLLELGVLPYIKGLYKWEAPSFDGILISHAHMDHYGLIDYIHPDIPVFLSKGTRKLIDLSALFLGTSRLQGKIFEFNMYEPFQIKDLRVMPFLIDHSAFDAAAFEISDKEKVIIYTGDFRGHGRKSICLERFIKKARKSADLLFIEGTVLGRHKEEMITEQELENWLAREIGEVQGPVLFQIASQNIDRLVSFYKAAIRLNKTFVIDIYTANILYELRKLGNNNLPYPSREYKNIKVFYPYRLTQKIYDKIGEEYAKGFSAFHLSKDNLKLKQDQIIMLVRPSMRKDLGKIAFKDGLFLYSLWDGYGNSEYQKEFEFFLAKAGFTTKKIHTSGHAKISDIKKAVVGLKPKRIVPIHTMKPDLFKEIFGEAVLKQDGEVFCI